MVDHPEILNCARIPLLYINLPPIHLTRCSGVQPNMLALQYSSTTSTASTSTEDEDDVDLYEFVNSYARRLRMNEHITRISSHPTFTR